MRSQINRLPADTARGFGGTSIDRSRPLNFALDGRLISGFAGDTVLTAALASGIDTLGLYRGFPIGLTLRASPAISYRGLTGDPQRALPMANTPAIDGAEFVTLGGEKMSPLARLFQAGRTLGLPLDDPQALHQPWRRLPGRMQDGADLLVVGGGVAGMSAALAGARAGLRVTLIEESLQLGGNLGLFGTQDGEESPDRCVERLTGDIAASGAVTVLLASRAISIRPGLVRVHRVSGEEGDARSEVIDLVAPRVVLATGTLERLPIFSGNRLPGVTGSLEAYALASRFGIWPGEHATVATGANPAYRLATYARDAGITLERILDSRPSPSSRFIEFSRAYGIIQSPGTAPVSATIARAGGRLTVRIDQPDHGAILTERLLVGGGWQPDLTLWHVAGGTSQWDQAVHGLRASGTLDQIVLAGSAAGYVTRQACLRSGEVALDRLLGRKSGEIEDPVIAAIYETPDAPPHIADPVPEAAPAFLDGGRQLLQRPAPPSEKASFLTRRKRYSALAALSESPRPLAICDVAAGVGLGLIPAEAAGIVAQERVALVPLLAADADSMPKDDSPPGPDSVPPYLLGRFGDDARVVRVILREKRLLDTGALIYRSSDGGRPTDALGVILRSSPDSTTALVAASVAMAGRAVSVHDQGRAISATIELVELAPA